MSHVFHVHAVPFSCTQMYVGARDDTLSHVQLRDISFVWCANGKREWAVGLSIDFRKLKVFVQQSMLPMHYDDFRW